jgi:hypothetical protein
MEDAAYPNKLAAVYPDAAAALAAFRALQRAAPGAISITHITPFSEDVDSLFEPDPDESRDALTRDTITGGAAIPAAAMAFAPALFVSAAVAGPLIVLGYGAMLGGSAGAVRGLRLRESLLAGLVKDALMAGCHVLIVRVADAGTRQRVQSAINETLA